MTNFNVPTTKRHPFCELCGRDLPTEKIICDECQNDIDNISDFEGFVDVMSYID